MKKNYPLILIAFLCFVVSGYGQTEIFNLNGGGAFPAGWTDTNNIISLPIDQTSYYLVQPGSPGDIIETATYDLSTYTSATFEVDIRSYGSGTHRALLVEVSTNGGTTFTQSYTTPITTTTYTTRTINIITVSASTVLRLSVDATSGRGIRMRDLILTAFGSAGPSISATPTTINNLDYTFGSGPSSELSFDVEGSLLTANIEIAQPTDFEISTGTGASFNANITDPIVLTQSGGTVASTPIYVRLRSGLGVNTYTETITATSTSATDVDIDLNGEVTPAPPANDNCSGAISLTPTSSCSYITYTNLNATDSGEGNPGCASYNGEDVWFSVVVPSTGELTIDTNNIDFSDGGMALYSGSCGSLSLIECDDDDSPNGNMPLITRTGLTPSTTVYIRVWEYNGGTTGDFGICVTTPTPCVAPTNQPTSLVLSNITGSSIDGSFTATTADEYLVVVSTSPTLSGNPVNGTNYNNGDALGGGTVVQSSNATTFTASGLSQTTQYYFFVFALNDSSCAGGPIYNTTNPLTGNATTITGPCLTTGFENADGWSDHAYGNWTDTDINGDDWVGNGIFAGNAGNRRIQMNTVGDWLELPPVDNPASLEYYARLSSSGSGNDRLMVQYYNGASWADIVEHTSTSTSYQLFTADLSSITALTNVRLRLRRTVDDRTHYIDDLSVYCGSSTPIAELQLVDNTTTNQNCGYTIDYGNIAIGATSDLTFDIENIGSLDLTINSLGITGDYSIVSPVTTPFTITAGNSQTVTVRFTPLSDGGLTGELTINNTDADEGTCIVNLTGIGFTPGPNINVRGVTGSNPTIANGSTSTSGLNNTLFAQQTISTTQQTKTFRIGNEGGSATLNVSSITLSGDTADFFVTSSFTNPFAINSSQDFTITFQPTTLSGLRSATVSIANSDSTKNPYTFVVEGTANCPSVSGTISPTEGPAGTIVTILSSGNDLTGATAQLNGVALTTVSSNNLELVVRLPNTIVTGGPLSVLLTSGCIFSNTFTLLDQTIVGCETSSSGTVDDLFISEITDSPTGSLTYIELYNATGAAINFGTTNYSIKIYNNGSTSSAKELILNSGTVNNNSTYVIVTGVSGSQCAVTGGDGSLSQVELTIPGASVNFFKDSNSNIGHDYIGLYSPAAITAMNTSGVIDSWGTFGDQTWAVGLGLGEKGANFQRDTSAVIPNTTYSNADWVITDWTDIDCSDVDYTTIGAYDFSTGVSPTVTLQPMDPTFACAFSASLSVAGTEGFDESTDTQDLVYRWFVNSPGSATWSEILLANTNYMGQQTTTLNIIDTFNLDGYQYYCQLRENSSTCFEASNAVVLNVLKSVWNGTWSSPPAIGRVAIINNDYNTSIGGVQTSFRACSLIVNSGFDIVVANGNYIEVENDVTIENAATVLVETQGAFIQRGVGLAAGTFTLNGTASSQVNKFTAPLSDWYDYTYWSSPVATADVDVALGFALPERRFWFNASNYLDINNDDIDDNDDDWQPAQGTGQMVIGRGYAATHSNIGFVSGTSYQYNFAGALNTGDYSYLLAYNASNIDHWNLVGNPYPSAIDVDQLFLDNTAIKDVVYLWSHFRDPLEINPGNEVFNFNQNDYLIINGTMEIGNGSDINGDATINGLDIPARSVASGQSFFVSSASANPILFNNDMRISGDNSNDDFYRSPVVNDYNKLWINLNSDNGAYSQTGIGYVDGATDEFDDMNYDAKRNESYTNAATIYSIIDGVNDMKFAIQGKSLSTISNEEVIPLGFSNNIMEATIFTIKALKFEGEFLNNNDIYIKDNLLNTLHNLKDSDFTFTSETGEFNNRFEIVFNANALSTKEHTLDSNDLTITELSDGTVQIKINSNLTITNVEILDITGRKIYSLQGHNSTEVYDLSQLSKAAYIAKVKLSNEQVISKKAIKRL